MFQLQRIIVLRGQASLQQKSPTQWEWCLVWAAFGRCRLRLADPPRHRSSRASSAPTDRAQTCWSRACPRMRRCGVSVTTRHRPSRASLAPTEITNPVGVVLGLGCIRTMQAAVSRPTPSSFFASKPGSYRLNANLLEPGLPANEALRCFSYNASSFIAGKPGSNGNKHFLWKILWAVVWCPRIRHRHS